MSGCGEQSCDALGVSQRVLHRQAPSHRVSNEVKFRRRRKKIERFRKRRLSMARQIQTKARVREKIGEYRLPIAAAAEKPVEENKRSVRHEWDNQLRAPPLKPAKRLRPLETQFLEQK